MSHKLNRIIIKNFRSIESIEVNFSDYTALVGNNNVGKSNILEAVKWFINPTGLDISDFHGYDKTSPVEIVGYISGITEELMNTLESSHQSKIGKYVTDGELVLKRLLAEPSGKKGDRKLFVKNSDKEFVPAPTGIPEAISNLFPNVIFVKAMEDVTKDISQNQTSTTIGSLISSLSDTITTNYEDKISRSLQVLDDLFGADSLNRASVLTEFDDKAKEFISDFFPDIELKLHIPTPTISDILKSGTVRIYEGDQAISREFSSLGHGAQRSVQMALIRLLAQLSLQGSLSRNLLIIEEPELYLHPKAIGLLRSALKKLSKQGFQVLFATHSPLLIQRDDIQDTVLVRKVSTKTETNQPLREAIKEIVDQHLNMSTILFDLTNSSKILFADTIVLLEGKTEKNIIPFLFEKFYDEKEISPKKNIEFVSLQGGYGSIKAKEILSTLNINTLALNDLDFISRKAISENLINSDLSKQINDFIKGIKDCSLKLGATIQGDLPIDSQEVKARDVYNALYEQGFAVSEIDILFNHLQNKGYWTWKSGDIENVFGIEQKGQYNPFLSNLLESDDWKTEVKSVDHLLEFFEWISS